MSQTISSIDPVEAAQPDYLAASVLRSLSRSFRNQFSISAIQALGLGLITFGLWPLWRLRRQFRDNVIFETQQLWQAAEWVRTRRGSDAAAALSELAKQQRSRHRWAISLLGWLCIIATVGLVWFSMADQVSWPALMSRTYRMRPLQQNSPDLLLGYAAWTAGLSIAYALHWLRVRLRVNDLRRFVEQFNRAAANEGVTPIAPPRPRWGIKPAWVIVAVIFWLCGGLWGVPLALAAAAQRGYINAVASPIRTQLLERISQMVQQNRPAVAVPSYVIHDRRCDNPRCRANLRAGGAFCARCGSRAQWLAGVA